MMSTKGRGEMSNDSIETARQVIRYTRGDDFDMSIFIATVTAYVRGKKIVSEDQIEVCVSVAFDHAEIGIYWEKHGYKNYKIQGLFGLTNSNFQDFIDMGNNVFEIVDRGYKYIVNYNGSTSTI